MYSITSNVLPKVTPLPTTTTFIASMESAESSSDGYQTILMMLHGDRIDKIEPLWLETATRPWDPPLVHDSMCC
ncbi:hypothetical protein V5N11_025654 [Cardamine amara subsp. amara]|uniref:Uncharacterized protein n=1 Tax=Cardamine amara subsp. amara TaxID=228776 RepID=A0ABD0ZAB0_CARAN